jgi:thiol-disulfide isomerase/thioredoxin
MGIDLKLGRISAVNPLACLRLLALTCFLPVGTGCTDEVGPKTTAVLGTPGSVLKPEEPGASSDRLAEEAKASPGASNSDSREPSSPPAAGPEAITPVDLAASTSPPAAPAEAEVELTKTSWDQFQDRLAKSPSGTKFTLVDAWATYCGPCKENFPHLVEMHHKYGDQGLRVMSLSLDDTEDAKAISEAEAFLREKKAVFSNLVIQGDPGETYEKLDISAIPAVFVFGPDGKEVKRFTLDDPNNQFTYEQVEGFVKELLADKAGGAESK